MPGQMGVSQPQQPPQQPQPQQPPVQQPPAQQMPQQSRPLGMEEVGQGPPQSIPAGRASHRGAVEGVSCTDLILLLNVNTFL